MHSFITIAIEFNPANRKQVEDALDALGNPADKAIREALQEKWTVHFMSGCVVAGDAGDNDHLVIEMSVDGSTEDGLSLFDGPLNGAMTPVMDAASVTSGAKLSEFLKGKVIKTGHGLFDVPGLNFTGTPGMTTTRIYRENRFAREIRTIATSGQLGGDPLSIVQRVREEIGKNPDYADMLVPEPAPFLKGAPKDAVSLATIAKIAAAGLAKFFWPVLALALPISVFMSRPDAGASMLEAVVMFVLCFICTSVVLVIAGAVALVLGLLSKEAKDQPDDSLPNQDVLTEAVENEDSSATVYNHLTGVSRMKPGVVRKLTLRLAFFVISQFATRIFRPGFLGDLGTIHFARWVRLPGTDKLLFFSNYGGSWESYLEDFITKASGGLTGVWSNTEGYPRTKFLFLKGATDGDRFKRWARRQQIATRFWYGANLSVTTARIRTNAALRAGLARVSTHDEAQAWLTLLGSGARPAAEIEKIDVQSLIFRGLPDHSYSATVMFQLSNDKGKANEWLGAVREAVSFGPDVRADRVDQLAFTANGLSLLGLTPAELEQFSLSFRHGMDKDHRSSILGDTGEDAPENWKWGHGDKAIDGVWLVYAATEAKLNSALTDVARTLAKFGGTKVHQLKTRTKLAAVKKAIAEDIAKEPFGFADGISQPVIKGLRPRTGSADKLHLVEPGEFLLGYPDDRGNMPFSPLVDATRDPRNLLPVAEPQREQAQYPSFTVSGANSARDLGRNGTYFVVRQIRQHKKKFDTFLAGKAKELATHPSLPPGVDDDKKCGMFLAAKMVGRWQDGTSLVRYPHQPGNGWDAKGKALEVKPDNDFLLGEEDPLGEACPFGSHVRRTNPRESFVPGSQIQIDITNRHRILRRGRFYDSEIDKSLQKDEAGLMFACANADIERQFEFIQQTWSMARQFHGLDSEVDPILGRGAKMGRLTIPTPKGPILVEGIKDFVSIEGGAYLFMPGLRMLRFLESL